MLQISHSNCVTFWSEAAASRQRRRDRAMAGEGTGW